jgi:hypothetical protein
VQRVLDYSGGGDHWQKVSQRDFLDYNKEIDPKVFQPELPANVTTIDLSKIDPSKTGLPQNDLTDDQIATKVVKKFFEAMIAGDYQKAGTVYGGIPGEQLQKIFERAQIKFVHIVEIGKPTRSHNGYLKIPAKVEVELNGQKTVKEFSPYVHPDSGRWTIVGGI